MSAVVSDDPKAFVSLARVAFLVGEFFELEGDERVAYDSPFVWWDRSKRNTGIASPMPQPIGFASANAAGEGRGPLWHQDQILHWFGQWRDIDVRVCAEAGDSRGNKGRVTLSPYREAA